MMNVVSAPAQDFPDHTRLAPTVLRWQALSGGEELVAGVTVSSFPRTELNPQNYKIILQ